MVSLDADFEVMFDLTKGHFTKGPSGHGKSLLARRCKSPSYCFNEMVLTLGHLVGSLLDVPTHTVNMTTLRSTRDIWRSYSMSPYEVRPFRISSTLV